MIHAKQWRNVEQQSASRLPIGSRANHETIVRYAPAKLVAEAAKLALDSNLEVFSRNASSCDRLNIVRVYVFMIGRRWRRRRWLKEVNRSHHARSNSPLPPAIALNLLFKKSV